MIPIVVASILAVGVAGAVGLGMMQMFRRREITMSDYLELPPPAPDEQESDKA